MNIRCLVVDDEPPAIKILRSYISQVKGLELVGDCHNALLAHDILHQKKVDLVFLDIKMPRLTGMDFIKSLSHPPLFIFVTAYREFAADGFELDAIDYMVKPVSFERFLRAISKVRKALGHEAQTHELESVQQKEAFVYLKVDKHMEKVVVSDILYLESWKDYVKVFFDNGRFLLAKRSISSMESLLPEQRFIRVHRSYLVPINKITGYNNIRVLIGNLELPIGRLYKQQVMDVINGQWLTNKNENRAG
ncbi:MAG TPA: LytTR family DNA-binding domain-containing protein [Chitinophagaceae bacterium]|nr:LytTR family DNA-binding domain-containing protein [Chitinophagaceae bacterium]